MGSRQGLSPIARVDIDNEPANGKEWLLGGHYVTPISPRWGDELLVSNNYKILDV